MKIAFLFDECMELGGAQRVINNLANYFDEEYQYEVEVINFYRRVDKDHFVYNPAVKITYLNIFLKHKNFLVKYIKKLSSMKSLKKYLLKGNYDIIIGVSAKFNIYLVQVKKGISAKIIGTEHIFYEGHSLKTRIRKRLYYKKLDMLSVLTDYDYEKYSKFLDKLIKIHNPIPNNFKFNGYNTESKKILAAGRLSDQKGFDLLIKAMPKVIEKYPNWELNIFGEGKEKEKLENLIKEYKLEKNVFIKKYSNEFYKTVEDYSFYVMSSRYEAFPCVLIEIQAKGLPAVSFDCKTGPNEMIDDGKDGILVEPENISKLSEAIIDMIEKDKERIEMSKNAVENSKKFTIDKISAQWKDLFENLLREGE